MKAILATAALVLIPMVGGCATIGDLAGKRIAKANLQSPTGVPIGRAELIARGDALSMTIVATGLEPGKRGIHLHTTGRCQAPDFASAGGHLNPQGRRHGAQADGGAHLGDLPNLEVDANRSVTATVDLPGDRATWLAHLFDSDGTALVIHAEADDYLTDPSGNSGKRIACGVVEQLP